MRNDYCIHFNGIQNEKCEAGVNYQEVARPLNDDELSRFHAYSSAAKDQFAIAGRIPCCVHNTGNMICERFRLPTRAELEQYKAEQNAFIARFLERLIIVRPAIEADIEKKGGQEKYTEGVIPCPICKSGQVHYHYAGHYNGHIGAECTTENCIVWQE